MEIELRTGQVDKGRSADAARHADLEARCDSPAQILYPGVSAEIVPDFRECDFGEIENLNCAELNGCADYQVWNDSGGEMNFPGGESRAEFAVRCVKAFEELAARKLQEDCAVIAHGGTIMAIMERYAKQKGDYYDFQVKNGSGYVLCEDGSYTAF